MFDIHNQINELYYNLRKKADNKADFYNNLIEKQDDYVQITKQLKSIKLDMAKASYKNDLKSYENLNKQFTLKSQIRDEILQKYKIKKQWLTPEYSCKKCNDTGFDNGKICSCYKKYYLHFFMDNFNFNFLKLHNFKSAKINEHNKIVIDKMQKYCNKFPHSNTKNFVFSGKTGTGKTFLTECIAENLINKNFNVIFISSFNLTNMLREYHYSFEKSSSYLIKLLTECDLLIIDDLGSEPIIKNITKEYYLNILNERQFLDKHTIFTTNLERDEIINRYDERFFGRLTDKMKSNYIELKCPNIRTKNI